MTDERWPRVVVHADMDAFYAAIEQLDNPELRGQPILVGPKSARGVVLTASYEARPFRVGSAMPMVEARRRCPQAIVVPPRFERYKAVSRQIMSVFADYSPRVEPLSLDEAFIDMSGAEHLFGSPERIGRELKAAVRKATGLGISVGISGTKYVAKVASAHRKPDGLTVVPQADARAWLAPLPVARLWGAGPKTQARLAALGYTTIGDIAASSPERLQAELGKLGAHFFSLSRAEDPRGVEQGVRSRSISSERTLAEDIGPGDELRHQLRKSADGVGRRLRRQRLVAGGVRVKLKRSDFKLLSRQRALPGRTQSSDTLFEAAIGLLPAFGDVGPFRLVGIAAYDLEPEGDSTQLDLGIDRQPAAALEATLDAVERRFGQGAVYRGGDLLRHSGIVPDVNLDFLSED